MASGAVFEFQNVQLAEEMPCLASPHEKKRCDTKLAKKKEWRQRNDHHSFEFQVPAISADNLPFILHAVAVFTAIADNDLSRRHFFNDDHVRGVIERDILALAASMTMEEIAATTTTTSSSSSTSSSTSSSSSSSSSVNHMQEQEAVFEFENLQLELNQLGRLIVVFVKPQSVTTMLAAEDDGVGHTGRKVEEGGSSAEGGGSELKEGRPSKMGQIMRWDCQSLKPQILQVIYGNDDITPDQLKEQIKILSTYSLKTLGFAMPMFYASLSHHYSTSTGFSVGDTLFLAAIIIDTMLILLLPKWGNTLVCISWLLLELATSLLFLSFNKHYAIAILAALLLATFMALLHPKLQQVADSHVLPYFQQDIGGDLESQHLGHLLDLSQGIASFSGLFTAIAGRFMVGSVNVVGVFFFCAIELGLYLSMVVTLKAVSHTHAKSLATIVMVLVVLTFIASCIPFHGQLGR